MIKSNIRWINRVKWPGNVVVVVVAAGVVVVVDSAWVVVVVAWMGTVQAKTSSVTVKEHVVKVYHDTDRMSKKTLLSHPHWSYQSMCTKQHREVDWETTDEIVICGYRVNYCCCGWELQLPRCSCKRPTRWHRSASAYERWIFIIKWTEYLLPNNK